VAAWFLVGMLDFLNNLFKKKKKGTTARSLGNTQGVWHIKISKGDALRKKANELRKLQFRGGSNHRRRRNWSKKVSKRGNEKASG